MGIIIQFVGWKIAEYFTTNQMCVIWWSYISITLSPGGSPLIFWLGRTSTAALQEIKQLANLQEKQSSRHEKKYLPCSPIWQQINPQLLNQGFYIVVFKIWRMGFQPFKHRSTSHPLFCLFVDPFFFALSTFVCLCTGANAAAKTQH